MKLLIQELETMGISPRLVVEDVDIDLEAYVDSDVEDEEEMDIMKGGDTIGNDSKVKDKDLVLGLVGGDEKDSKDNLEDIELFDDEEPEDELEIIEDEYPEDTELIPDEDDKIEDIKIEDIKIEDIKKDIILYNDDETEKEGGELEINDDDDIELEDIDLDGGELEINDDDDIELEDIDLDGGELDIDDDNDIEVDSEEFERDTKSDSSNIKVIEI
jgi:hypothetical protein